MLLSSFAGDVLAQRVHRPTRLGVVVGPSAVGSRNRFVGVERAIHLGFSVDRTVNATTGIALVVDAYAGSTMESIPGCAPLPPQPCEARTEHPGFLLGSLVEVRPRQRAGAVGGAVGVGVVVAPGAKGAIRKSGAAVSAGADYEPRGAGLRPVLTIRLTQMLSDVAGVRWIVAPAVGIRF